MLKIGFLAYIVPRKHKMEIFGEIQGKLRKNAGRIKKNFKWNLSKIPANSDFFGSNYDFFANVSKWPTPLPPR